MTKPYRFKISTRRYSKGEVHDFDPAHPFTRIRLERGIIEAIAPAKKREKKVVAPAEVKDNDSNND